MVPYLEVETDEDEADETFFFLLLALLLLDPSSPRGTVKVVTHLYSLESSVFFSHTLIRPVFEPVINAPFSPEEKCDKGRGLGDEITHVDSLNT